MHAKKKTKKKFFSGVLSLKKTSIGTGLLSCSILKVHFKRRPFREIAVPLLCVVRHKMTFHFEKIVRQKVFLCVCEV